MRAFTLAALVGALATVSLNANASPAAVYPLEQGVPRGLVNEHYIVIFKDEVEDSHVSAHWTRLHSTVRPAAHQELILQGATPNALNLAITADDHPISSYGIRHHYNLPQLKGYSAKLPPDVAKSLKSDPSIAYVEQDSFVHILGEQTNPKSWGLQRIDTRELPLTSSYKYPSSAGTDVDAYIVDTGIYIKHPEFEGRARWGKTFASDGDNDGNGHGTHVAGTVGSKTYGVAKNVTLIAVKVLDARGSGQTSDVIAGIEYVAVTAAAKKRKAVANMSLGGGASLALDRALKAAIRAGVVFAVAAGNSAGDACNLSPGRVPEAITVAASDKTDRLASFSEKGSCVDIIAPGVDITSTWNNGRVNTISGTSMATPHVTGVVALALAEGNFTAPAEVETYLKIVGSKDRITGSLGRTPNIFLYNNVIGGKVPDNEPSEPSPAPPNDPSEPDPNVCPFPQCLIDPSCTDCCFDC